MPRSLNTASGFVPLPGCCQQQGDELQRDRDRDTQRETETDRQTERQRETDTERDRHREREESVSNQADSEDHEAGIPSVLNDSGTIRKAVDFKRCQLEKK